MQVILLALLLLVSRHGQVIAKDYGTHGQTYQISEKDFLQEIQEKLQEAKQNGKLNKFQNGIRDQMMSQVNLPQAVKNIKNATISRQWLYDPSVSKPTDLADQNGKIFYKAGTKVNPLDHVSLTRALIFIDGSEKNQVRWALKENKIRKSKTKIIMIRGQIIDLMKENRIRLYFDQGGVLTGKFGIEAVPAIVEQEGRMLKVREVVL